MVVSKARFSINPEVEESGHRRSKRSFASQLLVWKSFSESRGGQRDLETDSRVLGLEATRSRNPERA